MSYVYWVYLGITDGTVKSLEFKCCLKTESNGTVVMSDGSSFHMLARDTGNANLPAVVRQQIIISYA